jgi:hypothetical protein
MDIKFNESIIDSSKEKILLWLDKSLKWLHTNWEDLKVASNREKKETIVAIMILRKMIAGEEVTSYQKRFLKSQSLDIIKILFHISLKFIPLPIPFSPLAVFLGKKVGINVLPSSQNLLPEQKDIRYIQPNFNSEWEEAERYPEFVDMGRMEWIKLGKDGYVIEYSKIKDILGNVDLNFDGLEPIKKKFVLQYIKDGLIEYPIVVKFSDTDYDLIAGNTRLSGLIKYGYNPKLWVVDISK